MPARQKIDWTAESGVLAEDLGRRTVRGGIWAIGGQGFLAAVQFLSTVILARLLLPSDFGLIAMAGAVSGFVTIFADLGLSTATVQRKSLTANILNALFYVNLAAGLTVMAVLILASPLVASFYGDDRLKAILIVSAMASPILAVSRQHAALLQRHMQWRAIQIIAVGAQLGSAILAVLLVVLTDVGYWALVAQSVTSAALTSLFTWLACSWRPGKVVDWYAASQPLAFGFYLSMFGLLNAVHRQSDDLLIGWRWGAADLGQYSRAYTLLMMPLQLVNGPIASAVVPALSRLQDSPGRWRNMYLDSLTFVTLVSGILGAVFYATAGEVVALLFGPGWEMAEEIFGYLALAMIFAGASNTSGWIFTSLGRTREMFRWALFSTPLRFGAYVVGVAYGATGVAISYVVCSALLTGPCIAYATRSSPVSAGHVFRIILPIFVSSLISGYSGEYISKYFSNLYNKEISIIFSCLFIFIIFAIILSLYSLIDARLMRSIGRGLKIALCGIWSQRSR